MSDADSEKSDSPMLNADFIAALLEAGAVFNADKTAVQHFGHADDPVAAATAVTDEYGSSLVAAGLIPLLSSSLLELTGSDRIKFLNNFCTADIKKLETGQGCEAFITNIKGRVLGHVFVYNTGELLHVFSLSPNGSALHAHLDRYLIAEDVEITDVTSEYTTLLVTGMDGFRFTNESGLSNATIPDEPADFQVISSQSSEQPHHVYCFNVINVNTLLLICRNNDVLSSWKILLDHGASAVGQRAFDLMRIEAHLPLWGVDIDDGVLAQEVHRTAKAISFTKGCYLGQEPIARIDALGHVNRLLCRLVLSGAEIPPSGTVISDVEGKTELGKVTTAEFSERLARSVAMGFVRTSHTQPETKVSITGESGNLSAVIWDGGDRAK